MALGMDWACCRHGLGLLWTWTGPVVGRKWATVGPHDTINGIQAFSRVCPSLIFVQSMSTGQRVAVVCLEFVLVQRLSRLCLSFLEPPNLKTTYPSFVQRLSHPMSVQSLSNIVKMDKLWTNIGFLRQILVQELECGQGLDRTLTRTRQTTYFAANWTVL